MGDGDRSRVKVTHVDRMDPERMSADERLQEVASLLAVGFLRHRSARAANGGEQCLAILRTPSEICP